MKTEGELYQRMVQVAKPFTGLVVLAIVAVSIWTPLRHHEVAERWFSFPNIVLLAPVPLLVVGAVLVLLRSLGRDPFRVPFLMALAIMYLGYTGMAISVWPHIVPPTITIWEAASSPSSHGFLLVGTLFIIPFILMYTAWSYYVFRGKVRGAEGYH
jgi:cytochrome d ubiquinol oxidase subunit II